MNDVNLVREVLNKIIGLPLRCAGRACDMIWIGFGNLIKIKDKRQGGFREVAEYTLHIQCSWRITDSVNIIVGSADKYIPNSKILNNDDFDWDVQGANRCDEQLKLLFDKLTEDLIVKSVNINKFGDIKIFLNDDYLLEVMPDSSNNDEAWRFFRSGAEDCHYVMTGAGIELI